MLLAARIARRLSLRPGDEHKSSPGAFIAVTGIALAMAIMIVAVSVVTGFKKEIKQKVTGFNAQLTVYPYDIYSDSALSNGLRFTPELRTLISETLPGSEAELTIKQPAIFKTDSAFQGVVLKGAAGHATADFIGHNIIAGRPLPTRTDGVDSLVNTVVISRIAADALNLSPGQKITTHFLLDNNIRTRRLTVRGIYDTHFSEYDKIFAFTPVEFLQRFNKVDSLTGSAIDIWGLDDTFLDEASQRLSGELLLHSSASPDGGSGYIVDNVHNSGALFFNWLDLLDTNVVVIIVLMALVASFTLVSSLFILILERVNMIGLFKALGATDAFIRRIFICMAERLVIRGMLIGDIVGIGLMLLQQRFHIFPLDAEAYYLNYVPVDINWWYVLIINIGALLVSLLVLMIPSATVARMSPAETMRFE